ncbi:MAG TPA: NAD(P)/FAD-dependent oxidoreductase [Terriglobales bacterium]|nr:NAD(P)/FAD-dependent oxidoreductase [Terriglobales bacterium]
MYDLAVIGGGPAGASASITAARYGAKVLLLERGRYPRHKVCGEFISGEAIGLLSSLLPDGFVQQGIVLSRARIFIDGMQLETKVKPAAVSIPRIDMDFALWKAALDAGVDARQAQAVEHIEGDTPFRISTAAESFTARALINASGRWSNLSSNGNGSISEKWLGLKVHFHEVRPEQSVDLYFFDAGYCGVQPVTSAENQDANRINVCAMVRAGTATSLETVLHWHPELAKRSAGWKQVFEPVTTFPLTFREPSPIQKRILLAGDAAGFVDPFVGDGISLALRSGALAAESLRAFFTGTSSLDQAIGSYREAYERRLAPVFRASSSIRRMLRMPAPVRSSVLFTLKKVPVLTRYLVSKTR